MGVNCMKESFSLLVTPPSNWLFNSHFQILFSYWKIIFWRFNLSKRIRFLCFIELPFAQYWFTKRICLPLVCIRQLESFNLESALFCFILLVVRSITLIWITSTRLIAVSLRLASFRRLEWGIDEESCVIALIIIKVWGGQVWRIRVGVIWVSSQSDERYLKSPINPCRAFFNDLSLEMRNILATIIMQVLSSSHKDEWIWFFVKSLLHTKHFSV